jgi:amino acid transporter
VSTDGHEDGGLARGVVGSARVIAFGASNVAPAGSVVAGLVIVVSYAGFASPLVVLIAFAASMCCASSIAEFARRLPSAGSLYTQRAACAEATQGRVRTAIECPSVPCGHTLLTAA